MRHGLRGDRKLQNSFLLMPALTYLSMSADKVALDWKENGFGAFRVGLWCSLYEWEVLRVAIRESWAGSEEEGEDIRLWMFEEMLKLFTEGL